ncbi:MAG: hypothetical protein CMI54_00445 [Parcubacteria group bacterium]|nr:hypothetical protein [Parcubacteria group bacterium]|tara:strand:- start:657 stop:1217 length:561 start_codon:yes stop_codon:yes gene_type:complete
MHTVSLEIAKELLENGWEKEAQQFYAPQSTGVGSPRDPKVFTGYKLSHKKYNIGLRENYAAPYLTEILEELPTPCDVLKMNPDGSYMDDEAKYKCRYRYIDGGNEYTIDPCEYSENPCDAAAKLWIELKKEKPLIEFKFCSMCVRCSGGLYGIVGSRDIYVCHNEECANYGVLAVSREHMKKNKKL